MNSVFNCCVTGLPKIHNRAGNITAIENSLTIPFDVKRIYYLYDIPGGEIRGGHAHIELQQMIIAASGSFDIIIDDGSCKKVINLNRPDYGLYVQPGIWRDIINFSSGSICLVLASHTYNEADYLRSYEDFLKYRSQYK